jgi:hypothetical protein
MKEALDEILAADRKVLGNIYEDPGEVADAEGTVPGDGDVMLSALDCGQAKMTTRLAGDLVPEDPQGLREILAGDITRKPHTAITSSRTK